MAILQVMPLRFRKFKYYTPTARKEGGGGGKGEREGSKENKEITEAVMGKLRF